MEIVLKDIWNTCGVIGHAVSNKTFNTAWLQIADTIASNGVYSIALSVRDEMEKT